MPGPNGDPNATLNRLRDVLVRNRWWVLATTCVVSLSVIRISYLIPDRYRSEATIFIAKPRVPEQYIVPNTTANAMESVDAIKREVLSRARMQQIIDEFGLYKHQRDLGPAELTERMRANIEVQPISKDPERRPMNAFLIAFTAEDPHVAQQITERLTSSFLQENLKKQQQIDTSTTSFLQNQVDAAKADLDREEAALRSFKMRNLGDLPEQSAGNLEAISGLQLQLQSAEANLARARQQHTYLEAMLSHYARPVMAHRGEISGTAGSATELQQEIARLRNQRDELLARYSPLYPDVITLDQQIADDEKQLNGIATATKTAPAAETAAAMDLSVLSDPAAIQLRSQLEANNVEIADGQKQTRDLAARIALYQRHATMAPLREQQMQEIQRNYDLARQNYTNLLNKETQSELATKLGMQQSNEQYQVIDPASLPLKPTSPHRQQIALGGLAGGLFAGLALAMILDLRDRAFHTERDVRGYLPVPLVVGVPPLYSPREKRRFIRRRGLEWALGSLAVVTLGCAQVYVFLTQ